jgi:hypothetical protein
MPGLRYKFKIQAENACGIGNFSEPVEVNEPEIINEVRVV